MCVCVCVFFPGLLNRAIINTGCTRSTAFSIRPAFRPTTLQRLFAFFYYQFIPATLQQLAYTPIFPKDIAAAEVFEVFIKLKFFWKFFPPPQQRWVWIRLDCTECTLYDSSTPQPIRRNRTAPTILRKALKNKPRIFPKIQSRLSYLEPNLRQK